MGVVAVASITSSIVDKDSDIAIKHNSIIFDLHSLLEFNSVSTYSDSVSYSSKDIAYFIDTLEYGQDY